jgi:hypothetical protein
LAVAAVAAVVEAVLALHLAVVAQDLVSQVLAHLPLLQAVVAPELVPLLLHRPVRAHLQLLQAVVVPALVLAVLPGKLVLPVRAHLVHLALLRVVVVRAVVAAEAVVLLQLLLSRQSFSAAMARSTP